MKTELLTWNDAARVKTLLDEGKVVLFPTETVYGIGIKASAIGAYDQLSETKNRPANKPFTLMCATPGQVAQFAEVNVGVIGVMKRFMPGEITLLLSSRKGTSHDIDLGTGVIGVRVPAHPQLCALIDALGEPLLVSSANLSGQAPATDFASAKAMFNGKVAAIVEGPCVSKLPSTILDMVHLDENGCPKTIREGSVDPRLMADVYQNSKLTVSVGSDHGGYAYKQEIVAHLSAMGLQVHDRGCDSIASVDYPGFGEKVARDCQNGSSNFGIVVCTSGIGISIAANKVPGVRCGVGYDDVVAAKMREHNNANVIAFGQKYMKLDDVLRRVDIFLSEKYSVEEKHHRRVGQLDEIL